MWVPTMNMVAEEQADVHWKLTALPHIRSNQTDTLQLLSEVTCVGKLWHCGILIDAFIQSHLQLFGYRALIGLQCEI